MTPLEKYRRRCTRRNVACERTKEKYVSHNCLIVPPVAPKVALPADPRVQFARPKIRRERFGPSPHDAVFLGLAFMSLMAWRRPKPKEPVKKSTGKSLPIG